MWECLFGFAISGGVLFSILLWGIVCMWFETICVCLGSVSSYVFFCAVVSGCVSMLVV